MIVLHGVPLCLWCGHGGGRNSRNIKVADREIHRGWRCTWIKMGSSAIQRHPPNLDERIPDSPHALMLNIILHDNFVAHASQVSVYMLTAWISFTSDNGRCISLQLQVPPMA